MNETCAEEWFLIEALIKPISSVCIYWPICLHYSINLNYFIYVLVDVFTKVSVT